MLWPPLCDYAPVPSAFPRAIPCERRHINRYALPTTSSDDVPSPFNDPNHPLDEAISSRIVHLVTPQGFLRDQLLKSVLRPLDSKVQNVRQVSIDSQGTPIVKIVSRKELQEQYQTAAKLKNRSGGKLQNVMKKELELNYAIDRVNDLQHRLKALKEWLAEGRPVEVLLAHKSGGKRASQEQCEELAEWVRKAASEAEGVEYREVDGRIGSHAIMSFRQKEKAGSQAEKLTKSEAHQKERSEKKARKEQERNERKKEAEEKKRRKEKRERELQRLREKQIQ